jgi:hypothetical protein
MNGGHNIEAGVPIPLAVARAGLGFRDGINGPHAARTMMLDDISALFARLELNAGKEDYAREIIGVNGLAKPTKKARELSFRFLAALYGLDPQLAVFRVLRKFWAVDEKARPVLALCAALARDPLLRSSQSFMLSKHKGDCVPRDQIEQLLSDLYPDRFTPASLKSFAQNISGTWSQAGYLIGRTPKYRAEPVITPTNIAYCLFLAFLEGLSGQRLFASNWISLLGRAPDEVEELARAASHQGLLVFLGAGGIKEVRFPDYLTAQEEQWRLEVSRV